MPNHYTSDRLPSCPGIYSITHIASGRRYIGSARNLRRRLWDHRCKLRHNRHGSPYIQNAWNKYGEEAFRFEAVETCLDSPVILVAREQAWMDRYKKKLFNLRELAEQFSGEWYRTEIGKSYCREHGKRVSQAWKDRPLTEHKCKQCGEPFMSKNTLAMVAIYCSRHCQNRELRFEKTCQRCGKKFMANRSRKIHCSRRCGGLVNNPSRMHQTKVVEIKKRLANGELQRQIAEDCGVSRAAVCRINRGKRYVD